MPGAGRDHWAASGAVPVAAGVLGGITKRHRPL